MASSCQRTYKERKGTNKHNLLKKNVKNVKKYQVCFLIYNNEKIKYNATKKK